MKSFILIPLFFSHMVFAAEQKLTVVKVGASPVISSAGIYLALEKGFFKEQGIDAQVVDIPSSGAPMTALVSKGELDVGAGNLSSGLFNAIAGGQNFKLVADKGHIEKNKSYIGLIVRKDHLTSGKYKTLSDLKGMTFGLTALDGVSQQIVAERFLKKAGLTEKDIKYVKMSYAEMNVALKTKTIDATIQLEPYLTKAKLDGIADIVASATEVHPKQQSAAIFYSPQMIQNKDLGTKFMTGYLKGIRMYNEALQNPEQWKEVVTILKKNIKIEDPEVWNNMIPIGLADNGRIDSASLAEDIDWYFQKGYLTKKLDIKQVVDNRFVEGASKKH